MKEKLLTEVTQEIKTWQKDNFHKVRNITLLLSNIIIKSSFIKLQFQTMMQLKERKEMEDQFKKAQKPWAKHLAKVEKTKADYHAACKTEKSASNQERNANMDSSLSPDQVKRMIEILTEKK